MKGGLKKESGTKISVRSQIMKNSKIDYVKVLKLHDEQRQRETKLNHIVARHRKLLKKRDKKIENLENTIQSQHQEKETIKELTEQNTKLKDQVNMLTIKNQDLEQNKKERDQDCRDLLKLSNTLAESNKNCKCKVDKCSAEIQTSEIMCFEPTKEHDEITRISDDFQSLISQNMHTSRDDTDFETVCPSIDYQGSLDGTQISSCSSLDVSVVIKEKLVAEKVQHEFNLKSLQQTISRKRGGFLKNVKLPSSDKQDIFVPFEEKKVLTDYYNAVKQKHLDHGYVDDGPFKIMIEFNVYENFNPSHKHLEAKSIQILGPNYKRSIRAASEDPEDFIKVSLKEGTAQGPSKM